MKEWIGITHSKDTKWVKKHLAMQTRESTCWPGGTPVNKVHSSPTYFFVCQGMILGVGTYVALSVGDVALKSKKNLTCFMLSFMFEPQTLK